MKTLRVAICDDDASSISRITDFVYRICGEKGLLPDIYSYHDGDELVERYAIDTDFLFLDVEMPLLDGIQAATMIRERDSHVIIVFMSNYEQYAIRGYQAGAWRYLLKPIEWQAFCREVSLPLDKCLREKDHTLHIKNDRGVYSVLIDEIFYLEVNAKKNVVVYTRDKEIECYQPLTRMAERLDLPNFYRCHNSYLVNMDYIAYVERDTIRLRSGVEIPLSKHRRKEFMQVFMKYEGDFL